MRYGQIRKYDVANGPGIRSTIFVTGCSHKCPGCFNEDYQDFKAGNIWTDDETKTIIAYLKDPNVRGLSLLGGEPFENAKDLTQVIKEIKEKVDKEIWAYSGYLYEEILENKAMKGLLEECDVLVDGLFVEDLKDLTLRFRGSSNQRIIDIKKSLEEGSVVVIDM